MNAERIVKESHARKQGNYRGVLLAGLVLGLVSLYVAQLSRTRPDTTHLLSGIIILTIGLAPLLLQIFRYGHTRIDFFNPAISFTGVYGIMFGFGFLRHYHFGYPVANYSFRFILFGYIGFFLGLLIFRNRPQHSQPKPYQSWPTSPLFILTSLIFAGCFAIFLLTILRTGWLFSQSDVENVRTETISQIGGVAFYLIRSLLVVVFLAALLLFRHHSLKRWLYLILVGMIGISLATLLATGYRNGLVLSAIGILALFHYVIRPLRIRGLLLTAIPFVILIGLLGAWRLGWHLSIETTLIRTWLEVGLPLGTMQTTVNGIPELVPHLYGRGILMAFLVLLPGEQPALSLWLKEQLQLTFDGGGFTPSILGGFYLDFGLVGIVVGMFCVGCLLQATYRWFKQAPSDFSLIFYCFLLIACIQSIRDGFLQDIFPVWFLCVIVGTHIALTIIPNLRIRFRQTYVKHAHTRP